MEILSVCTCSPEVLQSLFRPSWRCRSLLSFPLQPIFCDRLMLLIQLIRTDRLIWRYYGSVACHRHCRHTVTLTEIWSVENLSILKRFGEWKDCQNFGEDFSPTILKSFLTSKFFKENNCSPFPTPGMDNVVVFKSGPISASFSFIFVLSSIPITITASISSIWFGKSIDGALEIRTREAQTIPSCLGIIYPFDNWRIYL